MTWGRSDTHDLLEVLRAEDGVVELDGLLDVGHVQLTMRGGLEYESGSKRCVQV